MKKSFKVSTIIILMFVLVFSSLVANAYPKDFSVRVPIVRQEKDKWCWNASCVSILGEYGKTVSQRNFCITVKGKVINEGGYGWESQKGLRAYGLDSTHTGGLSFNSVVSETYYYERPVYAVWSWSVGGAHAVVLEGYDERSGQYIYYMDPWDGARHYMSYAFFKGGPGYDRRWNRSLYKLEKNSNF